MTNLNKNLDAIREHMSEYCKEENQRRHEDQSKLAEDFFERKDVPVVAISTKIIILKCSNKTIGTGFMLSPSTLITNTQVVSSSTAFYQMSFSDLQGNSRDLEIKNFDFQSNNLVVAIFYEAKKVDESKSFQLKFSDHEGYENKIFFCIDHGKCVHFLNKCSEEESIYECVDGWMPSPDLSGSPIFEGRVIFGRELMWEFRVVDVLFGSSLSNNGKNQVSAIPMNLRVGG